MCFFFFKQKTAYEMRISDWSSDVCSSDLLGAQGGVVLGTDALRNHLVNRARPFIFDTALAPSPTAGALAALRELRDRPGLPDTIHHRTASLGAALGIDPPAGAVLSMEMGSPRLALEAQASILAEGIRVGRSEEHTSELQSLMRNSYA